MDDVSRRLAGRYELGAVVGRGGMGTVHRARDPVLDRTVAVKLLPAALAEEGSSHVARFEREARAAASLRHEGVVAIYDTGEDNATRFIVMEFVDGRSLADVLREDAPLEPREAAGIVSRVAAALAAAHAAGIVHRDIKPANVMLADDGAVKVLDFGIARSLDGSTLTAAASVLGTSGYMAPEQALGERADERSDVYSLGCLLYALLTGSPPFGGESAAAVMHQHVNREPRSPAAVNAAVPPGLDALVLAMLAKSPGDRPQSAGEVHRRLQAATAGPGAPAVPPGNTEPTRRLAPPARTLPLDPGAKRTGRRGAAAAALAAAGILIAAIVALASGGGKSPAGGSSRHTTRSTGTLASAASQNTAPAHSRTSTTPPKTAGATAPPVPAPAPSVAQAAAALSSLLAQMAQAGSVDPQVQRQLGGALADLVASSEAGEPLQARHGLLDLARQVTALRDREGITAAEAGALESSLAALRAAVLRASPQGSHEQPSGEQGAESPAEGAAPGPGGEGPAKHPKHDHGHGGHE